KAHGIAPERVTWEPDVIPAVAQLYTREPGVRDLERRIARIARKLARRIAAAPEAANASMTVRVAELEELLGVAPYDWSDNTLDDKVGVATGLAFTPAGGDLLEIEVAAVRGRGRLQLTGTLGDVLKESAGAAMTYARSRAELLGLDAEFHATHDMHVHIPAGATPKDGPSAGIAIAVAMVSAMTGTPVRGDIAMTGEVTLRGRVLPIGGLKEKSVAAMRSRITDVIIPKANAREIAELPEDVRQGVRFHPVSTMDEVLSLALRVAPSAAVAAPSTKPIMAPTSSPVVTH
ncbi:MAG TPA: S16 family serine protease, partial [Gemmatimonadaceae bacterium]|nr:S16 family serine protease [Gemmatimonadaceae bacterium]